MTGIEKIVARIETDARNEAESVMAGAREKADTIAAETQKKADALKAELTERNTREAAERRKRAVGVAELEARKRLLETKQALIDRAFDEAREQLINLPKKDRVPLLAKLAAEASRTGKETVLLTEADRSGVGADVVKSANKLLSDAGKPAGLALSDSVLTDADAGGLILYGGEVEVRCTFAALLENLRHEMAAEIAGILFKE